MAERTETFTTRIFLNDTQAKSSIADLESKIKNIRKDMEQAANAGDWSRFNTLKKDLNQASKELGSMRTTAQSVNHVLDNLNTASVKEIRRAVSAINKELNSGSIERGSDKWNFLNEQLANCKNELKSIKDESKAVEEQTSSSSFWSKLSKLNNIGFAVTNFFGLENGIQGIIDKVASLAQESMDVAKNAEGIEIAFKRIDKPGLLDNLRKATHGTIDDIQLMQQAVKFQNFDLPVEQLGKLLAFAQQTAKDTGESIDYMTNSIVDGITRQSPKILDNLGLSAQKIKEKVAETGDFTTGVIAVIEERMNGMGDYADTAADRSARAAARMTNAQKALGEQLLPIRSSLAGLFGQVKLWSLQALTWILKNRDSILQVVSAIARLAVAIGAFITIDKLSVLLMQRQIVIQRIKVALDNTEIALNKAKTASLLLLRAALVPFQALYALITRGVQGYIAVMRAARIANMTNPWTALATVLTVVGVAIYGVVKAAKANSEALQVLSTKEALAKERASDLNDIQKDSAKSAVSQKEKISQLTKVVGDNTIATKDRMEAAKQLQSIVPGYFATLQTEGNLYNRNSEAIRKYISMLDQMALARAINKKIEENLSKQIDEEKAVEAWENGVKKRQGIIDKTYDDYKKRNKYSVNNGWGTYYSIDESIDSSKKTLEYDKSRLKTHQNILGALKDENKWLHSYMDIHVSKEAQTAVALDKDFGSQLTGYQNTATGGNGGSNTSKGGRNTTAGRTGTTNTTNTTKDDPAKKLKTQLDHQLALEEQNYQQGVVTYQQYLANKLQLQTNYYDDLKKLYKEGSDAYNKVCDEAAETLYSTMGEIRKDTEEGYEREHQSVEAGLKAAFVDPYSDIFQNQKALDEALFSNDMKYYQQRLSLYKEGTKEYEQIAAERDQRDREMQVERQQRWITSYNSYKKQFESMSLEEQEAEQTKALKDGLAYARAEFLQRILIYKNDPVEYAKLKAQLKEIEKQYQEWLLATQTEYARKRNEQRKKEQENSQQEEQTSDAAARGFDKAGLSDHPMMSPDGFSGDQGFIGAAGSVASFIGAYQQLKQARLDDKIDEQEWAAAKEQLWKDLWRNLPNIAKAGFDTVATFMQADAAYTQANCDYKVAMITKEYDKRIEKAGDNSAKTQKLEKERDKKIAAEKSKSNKKAMKVEIAQAFASSAMAAINAYQSAAKVPYIGYILAPIAAAAALAYGAMQIATIRKQHQAEEAGYYEGGFTDGHDYRREAGVVHQGEFVANHVAVNNPQLLPAFRLIDMAQRNNTVGSLTASDVSQSLGVGGTTVVSAPSVVVNQDNSDIAGTLIQARDTIERLGALLEDGVNAVVTIDGPNGLDKQYRRFKRLKDNV